MHHHLYYAEAVELAPEPPDLDPTDAQRQRFDEHTAALAALRGE